MQPSKRPGPNVRRYDHSEKINAFQKNQRLDKKPQGGLVVQIGEKTSLRSVEKEHRVEGTGVGQTTKPAH